MSDASYTTSRDLTAIRSTDATGPDLRLGRCEDNRLMLGTGQPKQEEASNRGKGSKGETACREEHARPDVLVLRRRHQYAVIRWRQNETLSALCTHTCKTLRPTRRLVRQAGLGAPKGVDAAVHRAWVSARR
jgi:hypothetical protein